jgi:alpha-N-arabinofuranosidase
MRSEATLLRTLILLAGWFLIQGPAVVLAADSANIVPNASFETCSDDQPQGWRRQKWGGTGEFGYAESGRTGTRSVMISSREGADVGWTISVPVEPFATYRLSGWIKTQDVQPTEERPGRGALLNLHNLQSVATPAVSGTKDWTRVEVVFDSNSEDMVQVNCLFGGWGWATGTAWYDDVKLELISTANWEPKLAIDGREKGHPISKYIYGQFIEHLGRCIYGGIWAEMLEDRKFYFPITPDYAPYGESVEVTPETPFPVVSASPWQIVGPADSVQMVAEGSFVGEHTPRVAAGGGIRQNDLGLVQGRTYQGYVWLRAADQNARVRVTLDGSGSGGEATFDVSDQYERFVFFITTEQSLDKGAIEISVEAGPCFIGTVSLMPADNVHGMRADTLEKLKLLNSPVYRWPGGNFVSGYDWRDGIGDRDRRPPRKNPAWTGVEHNDFGLDEFMIFCQLLDTEPLIVVNTGLGQAENAVAELEYANGAADTPMGKLRAENGNVEPYHVKWWGVGNEMYGGWQLGHMPLEDYIKKHNRFAEALRAVDPEIKLVAVGATGPWSEGMMQHCADHMDLISEHFYRQERPGLAGHVTQMVQAVRQKAEVHREYRRRFESLKGKDIDIALDEWNYWYGPHVFGELGTRYFLKDALGVAAALNEYARQSDIMYMANYAQTVNVIGCIKTTRTDAFLATTALPLKLYRERFGVVPLSVTATPPLDVAAALSEDGTMVTIAVVNPTRHALDLPLELEGLALGGQGTRWQIAGEEPDAYNDVENPDRVKIEETPLEEVGQKLAISPCSVSLFALELK